MIEPTCLPQIPTKIDGYYEGKQVHQVITNVDTERLFNPKPITKKNHRITPIT